MENLTQPTLLLKPFAENGQRNSIPENATGTNQASLDEGFPPVTAQNPRDGGIPPVRLDFNGLGHLTTTYDYFYQAGGRFTFNPTISSAIGGYPLNAALWYTDNNGNSTLLRSTVENNTNNFNNGNFTGWQQEIPVLGWSNTWTGTNTFSGNISSSGTNTFSGGNTFSGSVALNGTISGGTSAKETVVGWCMPDYDTVIKIGLTANGDSYTAPKDGVVILTASANKYCTYELNGQYVQIPAFSWNGRLVFPVSKGTVIKKTGGTALGTDNSYNAFIPAKGE